MSGEGFVSSGQAAELFRTAREETNKKIKDAEQKIQSNTDCIVKNSESIGDLKTSLEDTNLQLKDKLNIDELVEISADEVASIFNDIT